MSAHAKLSPSSASRWMRCPGSVALTADLPRESSKYADEGTAAHFLASVCLESGVVAADHLGRAIQVASTGAAAFVDDDTGPNIYPIDADMAAHVQRYLDLVRGLAEGHELLIEQRVPIDHLTGEDGATGTADAIILTADGTELIVIDLKYGRGVAVDAERNEQGMIYALGALEFASLLGFEPQRARILIHQPRIQATPSEWSCVIEELQGFGRYVADRAESTRVATAYLAKWGDLHEKHLNPGDKQCKFCAAKPRCPALTARVLATVADDFVDLTQPVAPQLKPALHRTQDNATLGNLLGAVDLIEDWCKALRAEAERELLAGNAVPGWKLVEGRRGARQWGDAAEAEATLKQMKLKIEQMYDFKLISPTSAEKLAKAGAIGPRQWPKLQGLITQPDGKPSVAPAADKRPAWAPTASADDFDSLA